MPSAPPPLPAATLAQLRALGDQLRAARKAQGLRALDVAASAGMSRVTLHRIEQGSPSVTMGAYLGIAAALGLELKFSEDNTPAAASGASASLPSRLRIGDLPGLRSLAWQVDEAHELTPDEAAQLYLRNWRHLDTAQLGPAERRVLNLLAERFHLEELRV